MNIFWVLSAWENCARGCDYVVEPILTAGIAWNYLGLVMYHYLSLTACWNL